VGSVTETDLKLAQEFGGIVYSFNAEFSGDDCLLTQANLFSAFYCKQLLY